MPQRRTVLVIEDNELNREILCAILENTYRVLAAENGAVGLDILRQNGNQISLILLDLQMPVLDGYGFLNAVSEEGRYTDIPIIVATASDTLTDELRCLDMGASDFVTKPYNNEVVIKRVESMIRLRETSVMLGKVEHDPITGALNKDFFFEYTRRRLARDTQTDYDMVCVEIEAYSLMLDRYGLKNCEAYIRYIFSALTGIMTEQTIVGKISDYRIAFLTESFPQEDHQRAVSEILAKLEDAPISNTKLNFGIYAHVDRALPVEKMYEHAFSAIGSVRNRYGQFLSFYDEAIRQKAVREQLLTDMMAPALRERQFKVYYQPKYDIEQERIAGAEALVRWTHPELGFLSPAEFIPLFEHNGFIGEVDRYILESVCRDLRGWIDKGHQVVPVSINVSQVDFDNSDLVEEYTAIIDKYAIPHELIHFEITETVNASDTTKKAVAVDGFRALGFRIELDDFGAGYSTLGMLGELPIDVMKIDMSLIRNMFSPRFRPLLGAALFAAASLKLTVVAEGVETQEQVDTLRQMCMGRLNICIQGYFFSKPVPAEQFETFISVA